MPGPAASAAHAIDPDPIAAPAAPQMLQPITARLETALETATSARPCIISSSSAA
jgi:hypothetical protein